MLRLGACLILSLASPALARDISLVTPIDCTLGEDQRCYIQDYMDRDPGPGAQDYACQSLSREGHSGTDFALRSHTEIVAGVAVRAAAPGTVQGVRDGMEDRVYTSEDAERIAGRECGNGLVLAHADGWETQYCHLRKDSVAVSTGDRVKAGAILGYVGMSGEASFPHLHFSLRQNGERVDPFAPSNAGLCNPDANDALWAEPIPYQPGGLIGLGFTPALPEFSDIKAGNAHSGAFNTEADAFVLWAHVFGARAGDILHLKILHPTGRKVIDTEIELERTQAALFRASGRRTENARWFTPGTYLGQVRLLRDGKTISDMETSVKVTD